MRILMINSVCGVGSTGRICTDLADALEQQGHEVKIAYGRGTVPASARRWAVRIGTDMDVRVHGACARADDAAGFGSRRATERFLDWVRDYDPDLIHLHNLHGYYLHVGVLFDYLKTCGKPVFWTMHDCWAFTGHSAYCDAVPCERWRTGCGDCPQKSVYPRSLVDRSGRNWARKRDAFTGVPKLTIITPSVWLAELVRASFLSRYPVYTIPNGVDTDVFHPIESDVRRRLGLEHTRMVLAVASVWDDQKGLSDLIRLAETQDDRFRLVLVGGMDAAHRRRLPENICYLKKTQDSNALAQLYSAADVFLNVTYCDTYPTTDLEALACGAPLVTYRTGGSAEIAKRFGGVVVERGDLNAVCRVIADPPERRAAVDPDALDRRTTVAAYLEQYQKG